MLFVNHGEAALANYSNAWLPVPEQVIEFLDAHYADMDPERFKAIKDKFQSQDPDAEIGL